MPRKTDDRTFAERLSARAESQRDLAGMCRARAESLRADLLVSPGFRDAREDEPDGAMWIAKAVDALRQAGQHLDGRARRNLDAVESARRGGR